MTGTTNTPGPDIDPEKLFQKLEQLAALMTDDSKLAWYFRVKGKNEFLMITVSSMVWTVNLADDSGYNTAIFIIDVDKVNRKAVIKERPQRGSWNSERDLFALVDLGNLDLCERNDFFVGIGIEKAIAVHEMIREIMPQSTLNPGQIKNLRKVLSDFEIEVDSEQVPHDTEEVEVLELYRDNDMEVVFVSAADDKPYNFYATLSVKVPLPDSDSGDAMSYDLRKIPFKISLSGGSSEPGPDGYDFKELPRNQKIRFILLESD